MAGYFGAAKQRAALVVAPDFLHRFIIGAGVDDIALRWIRLDRCQAQIRLAQRIRYDDDLAIRDADKLMRIRRIGIRCASRLICFANCSLVSRIDVSYTTIALPSVPVPLPILHDLGGPLAVFAELPFEALFYSGGLLLGDDRGDAIPDRRIVSMDRQRCERRHRGRRASVGKYVKQEINPRR